MKIYQVTDPEFRRYGRVLQGYDFTELFRRCREIVEIPEEGFGYFPSDEGMESLPVAEELKKRAFGAMPVQIGAVYGHNRKLGCLEYHKSSELNLALDPVILLLGCEAEVEEETFDTALVKAFLVPAGTGVELFGTTLHYAPCSTTEKGYRVICVLPRGTNGDKPEGVSDQGEDRLLFGSNKWLLAHPESSEAKSGAFPGLQGENITL